MATREDGTATKGAGRSNVLQAAPEAWPIPREVAGVALPDSKLVPGRHGLRPRAVCPVVFNHVLRTYQKVMAEIVVRKPETAAGNSWPGLGSGMSPVTRPPISAT